MKKILFLSIFIYFLYPQWVMFGTNKIFMYDTKSGEVFRYFEQDEVVGFMKLNYHKYFKLRFTKKSSQSNAKIVNNSVDIKDLQQTLLNNSLNAVLK